MLLRCKSAIMSNMDQKMQIRELHGTPYQIGFQSGSFFHGRVKIELDGIRSFMQQNKQAMEQMIRSREMLQYHYPSYYEETIGKADGLGIDRDVYMMLMHPEILQKGHESCTLSWSKIRMVPLYWPIMKMISLPKATFALLRYIQKTVGLSQMTAITCHLEMGCASIKVDCCVRLIIAMTVQIGRAHV